MIEYLYSLGAVGSFALNNVLFKKVLNKAEPAAAIAMRGLVISVALAIFAFLFVDSFYVPASLIPLLLLEIIVGSAGILFFFKALQKGRASIIGAIGHIYVIIVALVGIFLFGESHTLLRWAGAAIVMAGGLLAASGGLRLGELKWEGGTRMACVSILCWGIYYSYMRGVVDALGPVYSSFLLESGIFVCILSYALIMRKKFPKAEGALLPCAIGGGIAGAIGAIAYAFSIDALGVVLTAMIVAAVPVANAIFAMVLLGEKLQRREYAYVLLIALGLALVASG
ncbi:DMT family transporter [Candidatus Micrarchaeota archaeon]|nr:DMT family transporter [Candidatus Micrarchaeota archaeon]